MVRKDNFTDLVYFLNEDTPLTSNQPQGTVSNRDGELITLTFHEIKELVQQHSQKLTKQLTVLQHELARSKAKNLALQKFHQNSK